MPNAWWSRAGPPTAAVYGYTCWLSRLLTERRPVRVAACFDESLGTGFRHTLYPAYKSSRVLPDEELAYQLNACRTMTELLGVPCYASAEFEADDLLGTLAHRMRRQGYAVELMSRDKDLLQLLEPGDKLRDWPDGPVWGYGDVYPRWGVQPHQFADYLALVGDSGDDIPGVPGIGPKTAAVLLQALGSIPKLLQHLEQVKLLPLRGAAGIANKLEQHADQVLLMRRLTAIRTDAALGRRLQVKRRRPRLTAINQLANELGLIKGLASHLDRLAAA